MTGRAVLTPDADRAPSAGGLSAPFAPARARSWFACDSDSILCWVPKGVLDRASITG